MPKPKIHWSERVRSLHEWSLHYDWENHLIDLNRRWSLEGKYKLSVPLQGWPPAWFTGDIGSLEPDNWVLVVSLNPALARPEHYGQGRDKADAWSFWSNHNSDEGNWNANSRFFPRMTKLAATALGRTLTLEERPSFATKNMLFLEFCPYASTSFSSVRWDSKVQPLADGDVGFAINRQIRHLAMLHGKPRMIILHGDAAIKDVKDHQCPCLQPEYVIDPYDTGRGFDVWVGEFKGFEHYASVVGFKFLRRNKHMPSPDRRVEMIQEILRRMTG